MMYYILVRRNGTEKIQIQNLTGIVTSANVFNRRRIDWTYVEDVVKATIFDSARLSEIARDRFVKFSWITFRPISDHELQRLDDYGKLAPATREALD